MRRTAWTLLVAVAASAAATARAQESRPPEDPAARPADAASDAADTARQGADEAQTAADAATRERDAAIEERDAAIRERDTARRQADADRAASASRAPRQEAPLADRCVALMRGQLDPAERADVGPRCEELVRTAGERGSAGPVPGTGRDAPSAGESVRTAFTNAGREFVGQKQAGVGATSRGSVRNTLVTNPLGWFSGLGVNAEYSRPLENLDKISWVAAARYARANATNGQVTSFGIGAGVDLYVFGRNNEGLRLGPRIEVALGSENIQGTTTFGRLGVSGELGYNFIASSGLTAEVAGGLGTRLAGDSRNESFDSFTGGELGPYLKLGVGYSW